MVPQRSEDDVGEIVVYEFSHKDPEHGDLFSVKHQGVDQMSGHLRNGIADKECAVREQHEADQVRNASGNDGRPRSDNGTLDSRKKEGHVDPQCWCDRNEKRLHQNLHADEYRHDGQISDVLKMVK